MTTWLLGRPQPVVTFSSGYWPLIGIIRPGLYAAEGLTMAVKENPDYVVS